MRTLLLLVSAYLLVTTFCQSTFKSSNNTQYSYFNDKVYRLDSSGNIVQTFTVATPDPNAPSQYIDAGQNFFLIRSAYPSKGFGTYNVDTGKRFFIQNSEYNQAYIDSGNVVIAHRSIIGVNRGGSLFLDVKIKTYTRELVLLDRFQLPYSSRLIVANGYMIGITDERVNKDGDFFRYVSYANPCTSKTECEGTPITCNFKTKVCDSKGDWKAPTPSCWTCPPGETHWWEAGLTAAPEPGNDQCTCVSIANITNGPSTTLEPTTTLAPSNPTTQSPTATGAQSTTKPVNQQNESGEDNSKEASSASSVIVGAVGAAAIVAAVL
ncbi:ribosomal protein S16 [Acrasis kona]|uniref:Ribosomal protein S16 n=1 Tax=Acrasis kona TaxID=1008807 RepID=A0AAW2Z449_9EUKA